MASTTLVLLGLVAQARAAFDVTDILKAVASLQAPLAGPKEEFDGYEIRYGRFVFRPSLFVGEVFLLGFIVTYALSYFLGSWYNSRKANAWYNAHLPVLETQFSKPGLPDTVISDGGSDLFAYATGRRNIVSLHSVFTCIPRHNLLEYILSYLWILYDLRYQPKDEVLLDFKLERGPTQTQGYVWGLVDKDELKTIKNSRWDLGITKTQENSSVPGDIVVMSEVADITENILKSHAFAPVLAALKDPKVARHFRSLTVSDQPFERPENGPIKPERKTRHVYLSLIPPSPSQAADTVPLVKALFGFIDFIEGNKFVLRPDTNRKLKATRDELDKDLLKDLTEEKEKEAEDSKRAAKKRAQDERISKLSAEQQRKLLEKEKKKALRKQVKTTRG